MDVMSDVLDTDETIIKEAEMRTKAATKMAQKIEKFTEMMAEVVTEEKPVVVSTSNIAALIMKVPKFILAGKNETNTTSPGDPDSQSGSDGNDLTIHIA